MATDLIMPRMPEQLYPSYCSVPIPKYLGGRPPQDQDQQQQQIQQQQQQPAVQPIYAPSHPKTQHPTNTSPPTSIYAPSHPQAQHPTNPSPPTSLSTSGNVISSSPTSPKAYHTRGIRPLYMPAVLRPTEFPSKAPPSCRRTAGPRPPGANDDDNSSNGEVRSNASFISLGGLMGGRLTRRSTGDSGKCLAREEEAAMDLELFPKTTGLPTREHWKPDQQSTICDHPLCRRHFGYFLRRHHCRRCGNIFCDMHSAFAVPLDQNANYNPRGTSVRACQHCYGEFREWRSRTGSESGESDGSGSGSRPVSTGGERGRVGKARAEVALSVPRDWNWSTF